jgi:hypothetical protein
MGRHVQTGLLMLIFVVSFLLGRSYYTSTLLVHKQQQRGKTMSSDAVRIPTKLDVETGKLLELSLEERIRLLELKVNSRAGWMPDPSLNSNIAAICKKKVAVAEHYICADDLPPPEECVVYDMGIRTNPDFGERMARDYGCEVHAFDPSPVATDNSEQMMK